MIKNKEPPTMKMSPNIAAAESFNHDAALAILFAGATDCNSSIISVHRMVEKIKTK